MIGQTISHFKILDKLGEGGMGVVYKAHDVKLNRPVALKFFPNNLCGDAALKARFVQEARVASSIDHPNVVAIYEIEEVETGDLFIAMAYYQGETLEQKIREGFLKFDAAIDIALQIAQGLARSHELGIVHQDIKPANILFTQDGTAKILDFGVASLHESAAQNDGTITMAGTLPYMSPEQIRGEPVDRRTDIWSLAVVLYEMVSGRLPFTRDYESAIQYSILNEKQPPVDGLPKNVSEEFHRILDKALEKNAERRFQTIDELIAQLKSLRTRDTTHDVDLKPTIAVLPFVDLSPQRDQEYFCDGLTEELINALAKLGDLRVTSRISTFQFKGAGEDIQHIGERLKVKTVLGGSVRKSGDRLRITAQLVDVANGYQFWSERYDRTMLDIFSIQEEIAQMIVQTLKIRLLPEQTQKLVKHSTDNLEAYSLYLEGRYHWNKRNNESLTKAIELFKRAIEKDPLYALAYTGVADSYSLLDQYGTLPLRESIWLARAAAVKALELDDQLAEAHTSLAEVEMSYEWNWSSAERRLRNAVALNPNYATAHHWLATCLMTVGQFEESFAEINRALELDPLSLIMIRDKGVIFYYARQYDHAIKQARKTLDLDPNFALAHRLLAIAYERKGKYDEAAAENQIWGDLTNDRPRTQASLGHLAAVSGNTEHALKVLQQLEMEIPSRKDLAYPVALIYTGLRETEQTFKWLDIAYDNRSGALGTIKVDPKLDGLRSDPRFPQILRKMGLDK